jgi:hypothetical protein
LFFCLPPAAKEPFWRKASLDSPKTFINEVHLLFNTLESLIKATNHG